MSGFSAWCVVATEAAYEAREMPYAQLAAPFVVAIHSAGRQSAEDAANRAVLMAEAAGAQYASAIERVRDARAKAEPGSSEWAAATAHEAAILNRIAASVREIAQPGRR